jgi:hypothetical protein
MILIRFDLKKMFDSRVERGGKKSSETVSRLDAPIKKKVKLKWSLASLVKLINFLSLYNVSFSLGWIETSARARGKTTISCFWVQHCIWSCYYYYVVYTPLDLLYNKI